MSALYYLGLSNIDDFVFAILGPIIFSPIHRGIFVLEWAIEFDAIEWVSKCDHTHVRILAVGLIAAYGEWWTVRGGYSRHPSMGAY